ncbi:aldo/keto reductase [Orbaceae bacterium ac157xtp]
MPKLKMVTLPDQTQVPALGQGTWYMGESKANEQNEITALKFGIERGLTLIDTAEMYADGGSEIVVGKAIAGVRDDIFLVSKVLPYNASFKGTIKACENSLKRLNTDYLDLYLLHWPGSIPLYETIDAMNTLIEQGKIKRWGVSNFDVADLKELENEIDNKQMMTNQVLYNLTRRGIEFDLLPYSREKGFPIMAYSPIEQGRLLKNSALIELAKQLNVTTSQLALAWVLRNDNVIAIPKSANTHHIEDNITALAFNLTNDVLGELDKIFPKPVRKKSLEML